MVRSVAVLFGRIDSVYKSIPGCDVWDIQRDARSWPGGTSVIAHPPCRAWGRLRHFARPRVDEKHLALWAVKQVRKFGGVLEHPESSTLWDEAGLPKPKPKNLEYDDFGGWTLPIHQHWWGHKAQKKTWLYIVGCEPKNIPELPLTLGEPEYVVSSSKKDSRPEISKADRERTPHDLAIWLRDLAMRCKV